MTLDTVHQIIDEKFDAIEAESRRRFASLALADGADPDEIDAILDQNAAEWRHARQQAHDLILHSLRED